MTEIKTLEELNNTVSTSKKDDSEYNIWIVTFSAPWCGPCRMLHSVLHEIDEDCTINIGTVNVDESQELAAHFGVQSVPLMLLFKDGECIDQKSGFTPKGSLLKWVADKTGVQ